ncbi:wings apart-like protein homolog isoform X2 [Gouania willdenowi]|uniref:Wings apart-like protein homolog n=1 Tax=Gouania willdenowi TaxID=441366 RepID=A0A8C5GV73_GOUWI|nr:wings apart-like protein homolog isoform X2 [Gouania willdenowi]
MTSRFGKTYSRKGGEGTSKFDEVLSTGRGTLSTKWGATTYKAKVGSKRISAAKNDSGLEVRKRLRQSGGSGDGGVGGGFDDPFGFDSDEESKPVSSSRSGNKSSPAKPASAEPPKAERPGGSLGAANRSSFQEGAYGSGSSRAPSWLSGEKNNITEDRRRFSNNSSSSSSSSAGKPGHSSSSSSTSENLHSYSWYQNASESDRKPLAQSTALKTGSTFESWDAIMGLRPPSPSQEPRNPAPTLSWTVGCEKPRLDQESDSGIAPTSERERNCRTYRRPNKHGAGKISDSGADLGSNSATESQDRDTLGSDTAPPAGPDRTASLTQDGWQRKKETHTRPAPTQKSKKDGKLELFGFDDADAPQEEETSYKIKYFGFDDMSDSDGAEEERSGYKERRRNKMVAAATPMEEEEPAEEDDDSPTEEPPDPFERLERTTLTESKKNSVGKEHKLRADVLDFSEDDLRVVASGPWRPTQGKPTEKNPDSFRRIFSAQKKSPTKAVYNARHWAVQSEEEPPPSIFTRPVTAPVSVSVGGSTKEQPDPQKDDSVFKAPPPPPKVTKCVTVPEDPYQDTVTTLKCRKEHKELYTVVQHVKHFNDVVEFGENQEFTDDFEYLATGLKSGQPLNTRCLSVISLATRCAMPSFRMHLRARGKVAQVFKTLNDAPQHPNLALCTASLMYILSRDRLNMDLDRSCLDLMIRLLEQDLDGAAAGADTSVQFSAREIAKMKEKIRKLCDTVHNKHLDLQNITAGHLAMETLLSLTSKRAGDWFKEELRLLGGLDHIVDKVRECVDHLDREDEKEKLVSSLWGAERCLRVLESVTVHNPENQSYLIAYKDSSLIVSSAKALSRCEAMIQRYSRTLSSDGAMVGKAVEDCMRAIIGVLLNLTHDNEWGSTKTGEQEDLIMTALNCVLKVPQFLPQEQRFDIRVLGLGLLINLVEYSARNRFSLMDMEMDTEQPYESSVLLSSTNQNAGTGALSAIAALVQLFLQRERAAVLAEAQTDDLIKEPPKAPLDQSGQWQETGGEIQWVANDNQDNKQDNNQEEKQADGEKKKDGEDEELDLNKALQHAGKHMEDSIVASYTAMLLGCLCQGSQSNVNTVRENLPKGDFSIMTEMLKKFLNFMNLTCDVGTTGQKSISRIIDYLEHC